MYYPTDPQNGLSSSARNRLIELSVLDEFQGRRIWSIGLSYADEPGGDWFRGRQRQPTAHELDAQAGCLHRTWAELLRQMAYGGSIGEDAPPGRLTLIFPAGVILTSHPTPLTGLHLVNPTSSLAGRLAGTSAPRGLSCPRREPRSSRSFVPTTFVHLSSFGKRRRRSSRPNPSSSRTNVFGFPSITICEDMPGSRLPPPRPRFLYIIYSI